MTPPTFAASSDRVGLAWLITVRWFGVVAMLAVAFVGHTALGHAPSTALVSAFAGFGVASNLWLLWIERAGRPPAAIVPGLLVCLDVVLLSWLLAQAGGPLNPVSIFLLVQIVLAALVLGRNWTWIVTSLSVVGYGVLFVVAPADLETRPELHMAIGRHIAGMWWAFAATATLVAVLVARLASAVARRDRQLAELRDEADRGARLASLATLAAGAAHELSTPLGTIAVTARELEVALERASAAEPLRADIALIREELKRCRAILDDMSGRTGQAAGEMPGAIALADVAALVTSRLSATERARVTTTVREDGPVVWPVGAVTRALTNLVRNGLQASPATEPVTMAMAHDAADGVHVVVSDRGRGMPAEVAARVGEPFFTTKKEGEGLGLGVFVARSTVERLGGRLEIHSAPGAGTRVDLVLPREVIARAGGAP